MHAFYFVINLRGAPVSNRQRFIFETRLRAAVISGESTRAHRSRTHWRLGVPHCTAAPTNIEKLEKFDRKKVRDPFPKVALAGVGGARGRRGRRAQTFAATGPPR